MSSDWKGGAFDTTPSCPRPVENEAVMEEDCRVEEEAELGSKIFSVESREDTGFVYQNKVLVWVSGCHGEVLDEVVDTAIKAQVKLSGK